MITTGSEGLSRRMEKRASFLKDGKLKALRWKSILKFLAKCEKAKAKACRSRWLFYLIFIAAKTIGGKALLQPLLKIPSTYDFCFLRRLNLIFPYQGRWIHFLQVYKTKRIAPPST